MIKVSVLIPTYNRPVYLKETLESVVNQTLKPYEVIVADDNSDPFWNEKNYKVVTEFSKKYPFVKYHKNSKNLGPTLNYKNLFYLSSGDYVQYLGDDDILAPYTLEELVKPLTENENVVISAGKTLFVDKNLNVYPITPFFIPHYKFYKNYCKNTIVSGKWLIKESIENSVNLLGSFSGFMFKKSAVDFELFKFKDFEFLANADWFLWISLASKGDVYLSEKITNLFRLHGTNHQMESKTNKRGNIEILVFLSKEFLNHLGLDSTDINLKESVRNCFQGLFSGYIDKDIKKDFKKVLREVFNDREETSDRKPFSIVIVTYNSADSIEKCIKSINDSYILPDDEVIVVDNNSKDNTCEIISQFKNIKLIRNNENLGYSKAINQGVRLSRNNYLVFLNPDTKVISKDWLNRFYKALNQEDTAIVGPVSNTSIYKNSFLSYLPNTIYLTDKQIDKILKNLYDDYKEITSILIGFCIAIKKDTFINFGMFDENLILGFDDFDFSLKAQEKNLKQYVLPFVYIYHENHISFKKDINNANKLNKLSLYNFIKKLIKKYGYGNVPTPYDLFFPDVKKSKPFYTFNLSDGRYRYVFNFSNEYKHKNFFREKAKILKAKPYISILTVNYYSSNFIKNLVQSILDSDYPNINFVVVDNSENEEEYKKLEDILADKFKNSKSKKYYLIKNINNGYAGGNNLGINFIKENLKSLYIWILNPDTKIEKNTPFELLKTLEYTGVDVVTCKIKNYDDEKIQYVGDRVYIKGEKELKDYGLRYVESLSGANIFLRSEVFDKIGFFNEDYFLYFEDNDIFMKMEKADIYPVYTPFTFIRHKTSGTSEGYESIIGLYYITRNRLIIKDLIEDYTEKYLSLFSELLSIINTYNIYDNDKKIIVLEAIYDYIKDKKGKKQFKKELEEDILERLKNLLDLENINLDIAIEKKYLELKLNPNNIENFSHFISLVIQRLITEELMP